MKRAIVSRLVVLFVALPVLSSGADSSPGSPGAVDGAAVPRAVAGPAPSDQHASGTTWHVYADGSGDAPTIKTAVAWAASGDSILVYPGTYNEHDIYLNKELYIVGVAGEGSTIIDAQTSGRCFILYKWTSQILVKGFTMRHGTGAFDPVYNDFGGAMLCRGRAHVKINDCTFTDNMANLGGAIQARDSSTVSLKRCTFVDNEAHIGSYPGTGGAISMSGHYPMDYMLTVVVDSCVFAGNTAQLDGGAIYMSFCDLWAMNSTFYQNQTGAGGATITLGTDAGIALENTIVSGSNGYGIVAWYAPLPCVFTCNDFYGNAAGNYAGLIADQTGTNGNIAVNPLFCNPPGDLSISTTSPCAPAFSPCGELIGRFGPSCGPNLAFASVVWTGTNPQPGTDITCTVKVKNYGSMNAGGFYVDYYRDRTSTPPVGLTGDERYYVTSLAAGDSVTWTTSPVSSSVFTEWQSYFRVDTGAQIPESNEDDNLSGPHTIAWQVPAENGWPQSTGAAFHSSMVIADIDGDPAALEVAVGCDNGRLYVWKQDGTALPGFPVTLEAAIKSSPAVGNIYGNYRNEIVFGCDDGRLWAFDADGVDLWRYSIGIPVETTPSLADLNDDGRMEIICAAGSKIYAFDGRGEMLKGWPYEQEVTFAGAAVGDVDDDGLPEIAAVARSGESVSKVYLLERNGELYSGAWPVQLDAVVTAGPSLGDIDVHEHGLEIVVGSTSGRVYVIKKTGEVWPTIPQVTGSIDSPPVIADVNNDGNLDVLVASKNYELGGKPPVMRWQGYVTAVSRTGAIISGWPQASGFWPSDVGPAPSPIALGLNADVMAGTPNNRQFSWYGSGARTPSFPIYLGANIITSAAARDTDGDGWVELFVATNSGQVHGFELRSGNYSEDDLWWPMLGHDRARTSCYSYSEPVTAVVNGGTAVPRSTSIGSIYPNPFNPVTRVVFDVASDGPVDLAVYDVSGRRVATLADRVFKAGRHEIFWTGATDTGTEAASGVYFCRLMAGGVAETRKMVLVR